MIIEINYYATTTTTILRIYYYKHRLRPCVAIDTVLMSAKRRRHSQSQTQIELQFVVAKGCHHSQY